MALFASLVANAVIAATPATPLPWYNFQDYPQKAFDREWQGTTTMAVLIDPAGRVADCSVVKSSGYAELDKQTCWVAMRRVKFSPAIDPNGQRAYGLYRSNVIWSRPDRDFVQTDPGPDLEVKVNALPAGTMQPAAVKLAYYVDAQGNPSSCTVLPESALYRPEFQNAYAQYDPDAANKLLDEIGLTNRDGEDFRLLPDGRPLSILVDTANQIPEESDVLELLRDSWAAIGVRLYTKPFDAEVFRERIFSGQSLMSVWTGLDNGLPTAESSPQDLAPVNQAVGLQWPKWGQYYESKGKAGEAPDMPEAKELMTLLDSWNMASSDDERTQIWEKMLGIWGDQVFTIGTVAAVPQPIVVSNRLHNVPAEAMWSFSPGEFFGIYRPDVFWLDPAP